MSGFRIFAVGGIPVFVNVWFLALCGFYMWSSQSPQQGLVFAVCVGLSILVHELGHALVARHFKLSPQILLHGLGGLCFHQQAERDRDDALIIIMGPLFGIFLGLFTLGVHIALEASNSPIAQDPWARLVFLFMYFINFGWSLVNLLPIWPLDGGQLFLLGLGQVAKPSTAERATHAVSVTILVAAMVWAGTAGQMFILIIAGMLLYQNLLGLSGKVRHRPVRMKNSTAKPMVEAAEAALEAGEYAEAARQIHLLRDANGIPPAVMKRAWVVAGVATTHLGRHEEALSYLRRAPAKPKVVEAMVECLHMLDLDRALDALLASPEFGQLPAARREEILSVVRPGNAEPDATPA